MNPEINNFETPVTTLDQEIEQRSLEVDLLKLKIKALENSARNETNAEQKMILGERLMQMNNKLFLLNNNLEEVVKRSTTTVGGEYNWNSDPTRLGGKDGNVGQSLEGSGFRKKA